MSDALAAGRVTMGLPALTPLLRAANERLRRRKAQDARNLREKLDRETRTVAPDAGVDVANAQAQLGRSLDGPQFRKLLKSCNHNIVFEVSRADPSKTGVYVIEGSARRFVCGMETSRMPEFSIIHTKTETVPDPTIDLHNREVKTFSRETRGWRTVLARLLRERLITTAQIENVFKVHLGRSSERWAGAIGAIGG